MNSLIASGLVCFLYVNIFGSPFGNLDFENVNISELNASIQNNTPFAAKYAVPRWRVFIGGDQQESVLYQDQFQTRASVTLWDKSLLINQTAYDGRFFVGIYAGTYAGSLEGISLSQMGDVPAGSKSLRFMASIFPSDDYLSVKVQGVKLPLQKLEDLQARSAVYGVDISGFSGQTVELRLEVEKPLTLPFGAVELDGITFSEIAVVPEPAPVIYLLIGSIFFLGWSHRRHRALLRSGASGVISLNLTIGI